MKFMVYGGKGWLGSILASHFEAQTPDTNILDIQNVRDEVRLTQPDVVINAAAECGRTGSIDWCDQSPETRQLTMNVNAYGPRVLLDAVRQESDALFVHLSTGCLWNVAASCPPIAEDSVPNPPNFYSQSKAIGEENLRGQQDVLIVRLRLPISPVPHPRNLIDKLKFYKQVLNGWESMTFTETMSLAIEHLAERRCTGIYHVVNGALTPEMIRRSYEAHTGECRPFEVMTEEQMRIGPWPLLMCKRATCRLSTKKLRHTGFVMPDVLEMLEHTMVEYAQNQQRGQ